MKALTFACLSALLVPGVRAQTPAGPKPPVPALSHVQTEYEESCGGCHGIQGISAAKLVPPLKGRAGFFLCTAAGRRYMIQLPDVAFSGLADPDLAQVINFVVFDLGGENAPQGAKHYTPAEVHRLRADTPLRTRLSARRRSIIAGIVKACSASAALLSAGTDY